MNFFIKSKSVYVENERFKVTYLGLPIILGEKAGKDTIIHLINLLKDKCIEEVSRKITGYYAIFLEDKEKKETNVFVDNSSVFKLFYSKRSVSDSLLTISKQERKGEKDILQEKVIEFLRFGTNFYPETLIDGIYKLHGNHILKINCKNDLLVIEKSSHSEEMTIEEYFDLFKKSVSELNVSIDITGGLDSRMIAVMADRRFEYSLCSFGNANDRETKISKKISEVLKKEFVFVESNNDCLEEELGDSLEISEGCTNIVSLLPELKMARVRAARKTDLSINGVGGEFFKEILLMHEFPLYSLGKINEKKLLKIRFEPIPFKKNLLTPQYEKIFNASENNLITKISKLVSDKKTVAVNKVWYYLKIPAVHGCFVAPILRNYHSSCSPFLDYGVFNYSLKIGLKERVFDIFHRRHISKYNSLAARIRTAQDVTASYNILYISRDLFVSIYNRSIRLTRKIVQRVMRKTVFLEVPVADGYYKSIRKTKIAEESLEYLKALEILKGDVSLSDVSNNILGNVISLSYFLKKINNGES